MVDYSKLLEDFWRLPALVAGAHAMAAKKELPPGVKEIWQREGWTKDDVMPVVSLCLHEIDMVKPHILGEPIKITDDQYELLRIGLGIYTQFRLDGAIDEMIKFLSKGASVLDYCGGAGGYLTNIIDRRDDVQGVLMDKNPAACLDMRIFQVQADFKEDPEWYHQVKDLKYDMVLLNEVLHCQGADHADYLVGSALDLLRKDGVLIIGERQQSPEFEWRMNLATEQGKCISMPTMIAYLQLATERMWSPLYEDEMHYFVWCYK